MSRPDIDKIKTRLREGRAQNPSDVREMIAEVERLDTYTTQLRTTVSVWQHKCAREMGVTVAVMKDRMRESFPGMPPEIVQEFEHRRRNPMPSKWTMIPPAYKANVQPCHFITGDWTGDFFEVDVWEIRWSESDNYWMLLDNHGAEWGCIAEDFPVSNYYMVLPSPPKGATDD